MRDGIFEFTQFVKQKPPCSCLDSDHTSERRGRPSRLVCAHTVSVMIMGGTARSSRTTPDLNAPINRPIRVHYHFGTSSLTTRIKDMVRRTEIAS